MALLHLSFCSMSLTSSPTTLPLVCSASAVLAYLLSFELAKHTDDDSELLDLLFIPLGMFFSAGHVVPSHFLLDLCSKVVKAFPNHLL